MDFFEKPITEDEKAIAEVLEKMHNATRSKNIDILESIVSNHAQIAIFDKNWQPIYVNKESYLEHMRALMPEIRKFDYKNVLIRVMSDTTAVVTCSRILMFSDPTRNMLHGRYFKFQKENEEWLLTRADYIGS
ncbi:MAG: hypothetical protein A3B89_03045 [Candidatus Buchananbacteria bacterium RIFCSPHIGHO2_02_FULL_40_13]|nr:MAG: hypothetical protein A3B89_03045 [Candidatus Buchananbacteria bacterium RIFCSPHIGHO2_02_FULL_40_13]